jgi:hypothetical protein
MKHSISFGVRGAIYYLTTPMHLTTERLSVGNRRLPAAGDSQGYVA